MMSRETMPGAGEEADHHRVGGHGEDSSAPPSEVGEESEVSGAERSDDLFDESDGGSETSSDWVESRSRVTTPDSSTPSSPEWRLGAEEEA